MTYPESHIDIVNKILQKEFNETALSIERMTTGNCNEVYVANLPSRSVIVRMNKNEFFLKGSDKHIPLLASKGIQVPEVLAADYSKDLVPFAYQIQSKTDGQDLHFVIASLSDEQLKDIAKEIARIFHTLETIPTNGKYGWIGADESRVLEKMERKTNEHNKKTGAVGEELLREFKSLLTQYRSYFDSVPSTFYFDDLSAKNVLIKDGAFVGLVDLDDMAYGDPLEAVGRIQACWFGTHYGDVYTQALEDELQLKEEQRKIVTVYAILNRIFWLSEKGIQFNENTSTKIDPEVVFFDKQIIHKLLSKLKNEE